MSKYEEYKAMFEKEIKPLFPKAKLKSLEEFLWDEYRDNVCFYLCSEWTGQDISSILYSDLTDEDYNSEEITEAEEKAYDLQDQVEQIMLDSYEEGENVQNCAYLVYEFLKKNELIKEET